MSESSSSSSSRITRAFEGRAAAGQVALVPYLCAGYPDRDRSLALLRAAADSGGDVLELGIPFSDPLADGPTIQRATFEALRQGMTVTGALELLREFRVTHDTPVVLFTYLNPVHHYGMERFVRDAVAAGADGLLLTDLPAGADAELEGAAGKGGLDLIRLLAPTTRPERVAEAGGGGGGFVYYISRTGVTGAQTEVRAEIAREVEALREALSLPIAVGFGISTPEQAALVAGAADGVVVGSALLEAVDRGGVEEAGTFLRSLREAMDAVSATS
jgi:tryptophan synthase alpha chain